MSPRVEARRVVQVDPRLLPEVGRSAADAGADLAELRELAAGCRGCDLWRRGTQTVFGQGSAGARIMLVGEQPGDQEDKAGEPFVGPAGRVLDRALTDAGIDRERAFVTNVVKHFKWRPSGKRRLHERPSAGEVRACRPWFDAELALVGPSAVVCLGATAAQALLGKEVRVSESAGILIPSDLADRVVATLHPSAVLRGRDDASRTAMFERLVGDLRLVA